MRTCSMYGGPCWRFVAAVALSLVLVGCGGTQDGASGEESVATDTGPGATVLGTGEAAVDIGYTGREARDASELDDYVDAALERAQTLTDASEGTDLSGEDLQELEALFQEGNAAYRQGDYATAVNCYENVFSLDPLHYGANVNLALAYLQSDQPDIALEQALASFALYRHDDKILLNVQTAAVACGFTAADGIDAARRLFEELDMSGGFASSVVEPERAYNELWDRMETALHGITADNAEDYRGAWQELHGQLAELVEDERFSGSADGEALMAYWELIGEAYGIADAG